MQAPTLKEKARSVRDYALFLFCNQSRINRLLLVVDGIVLIVAIIKFSIPTGIALVLPAVHVGYLMLKYRRTIQQFRVQGQLTVTKGTKIAHHGKGVTIDLIEPSVRQSSALGFQFKSFGKSDAVIMSPSINKALQTKDWRIEIDNAHPVRVRRAIAESREFCLQFLTERFTAAFGRQLFTNDHKLCLASELDEKCDTVRCHRGGYFDSFCTNEACTVEIVDRSTHSRSHGSHLFPVHFDAHGKAHLDDLETAAVNNHIGITTIAITSDRHFVILQQGRLNIQDPGKVVGTGSGSSDFGDLHSASLRATIVCGMERELHQEALRHNLAIKEPDIAATSIVGFFKWLSRGGKPEFVGITRLAVRLNFIVPDHKEVDDVRETQSERRLENYFYMPTLEDVPRVFQAIREYEKKKAILSLPLKVLLARIEELRASDPMWLQQALYGNSYGENAPAS